jgi:hypothetical protein
MNAQPDKEPERPHETQQQGTTPPAPLVPDHVRTEGETTVDDALGAADDPR